MELNICQNISTGLVKCMVFFFLNLADVPRVLLLAACKLV